MTLTTSAFSQNRMFEEMEKYLFSSNNSNTYPPYNIVKEDDENYTIELAVAGLSKEDLKIELKENKLFIEHEPKEDDRSYYHKGISNRGFKRMFHLHRDIVVESADIENGILTVNLKLEVPEERKPRMIEINDKKKAEVAYSNYEEIAS